MAANRKKIYVITVSNYFPKGHIRAGEPTGFVEKIIKGDKIHTIRENSQHWRVVANQVNSGKAILSLRYWSGAPYRSKQVEFMELSSFYLQEIYTDVSDNICLKYGPPAEERETIANNDGLSLDDFNSWFKAGVNGIIIHFTDFTY